MITKMCPDILTQSPDRRLMSAPVNQHVKLPDVYESITHIF